MADVVQGVENGGKRRNSGKKKGKKPFKRQRMDGHKVKVDKKMKRLYEKRARDYNSDNDEEEEDNHEAQVAYFKEKDEEFEVEPLDDDGEEEKQLGKSADGVSEDEKDGGIQPGITKFAAGIESFKVAFLKIVKKRGCDDVLGPVLSAQKKLIAEKLAEEEADKKVKGEMKKEKLLIKEKGHVKPAENFLDAHEKVLLGVATKGVVKLFNAVNKAQNAQRGLNPSRSKDEKVIKKRRKEAFFSELGNKSSGNTVKVGGSVDDEAPAWAPLRDNYMLTNPKLKDWDKMQDTNDADDYGRQSDTDSASGDD